jgi:hypothetical protein
MEKNVQKNLLNYVRRKSIKVKKGKSFESQSQRRAAAGKAVGHLPRKAHS